jgi:hypothetical protein
MRHVLPMCRSAGIQGSFKFFSISTAHAEFTAAVPHGAGLAVKGRNAMKRSFRVATVFTGAAAFAVTLAPTAEAAPVAPGALAGITPDATTAYNCTSSELTSGVMLKYTAAEKHKTDACATGIAGDQPANLGTGKRFSEYCAARSSGNFLIAGTIAGFTPGYHPLYGQEVSVVSISRRTYYGSPCHSQFL